MIAALAAAKGVNYAEMAAYLGVHRNRFSDKVKGKLPFKEAEIMALAAYFDVSPGTLFEDPVALLTGGSSSACTRTPLRLVAA